MTDGFKPIEEVRSIRCSCGTQLTLSKDHLLDLLEFDTIRPYCDECKTYLKISRIGGRYFIRES